MKDKDPNLLLPEHARLHWCALPRNSGYHLFAAGALFGAGTALSIAGYCLDNRTLQFGFPAGLAAMWVLKMFFRHSDRTALESLEKGS